LLRAPIRRRTCCRITPPARRPVRSVINLTPPSPADNLMDVLCVGVPLQRWFEHPEGWEGRAALWTGTRAPEGPISQPRHGSATRPRLTTSGSAARCPFGMTLAMTCCVSAPPGRNDTSFPVRAGP